MHSIFSRTLLLFKLCWVHFFPLPICQFKQMKKKMIIFMKYTTNQTTQMKSVETRDASSNICESFFSSLKVFNWQFITGSQRCRAFLTVFWEKYRQFSSSWNERPLWLILRAGGRWQCNKVWAMAGRFCNQYELLGCLQAFYGVNKCLLFIPAPTPWFCPLASRSSLSLATRSHS